MGREEFHFTQTNNNVRILKLSRKVRWKTFANFTINYCIFVNITRNLEFCKDPVIIQIDTMYLRDMISSYK